MMKKSLLVVSLFLFPSANAGSTSRADSISSAIGVRRILESTEVPKSLANAKSTKANIPTYIQQYLKSLPQRDTLVTTAVPFPRFRKLEVKDYTLGSCNFTTVEGNRAWDKWKELDRKSAEKTQEQLLDKRKIKQVTASYTTSDLPHCDEITFEMIT